MSQYRLTVLAEPRASADPADLATSLRTALPAAVTTLPTALPGGHVSVRVAFTADDDKQAIGLARGARQSASLFTVGQPLIERLTVRRARAMVDLTGQAR